MKVFGFRDLQAYIDEARRTFVDTSPQVRLEGSSRAMTESEFMALCYFKASLSILGRHGGLHPKIDDLLEIRLDIIDSEPDTDGA